MEHNVGKASPRIAFCEYMNSTGLRHTQKEAAAMDKRRLHALQIRAAQAKVAVLFCSLCIYISLSYKKKEKRTN